MDFHTFALAVERNVGSITLGTALNLFADLGLSDAPTLNPDTLRYEYTHEALVRKALATPAVVVAMNRSQKIVAIKELRAVTGCGLKQAKDAVEDNRVMQHYTPF